MTHPMNAAEQKPRRHTAPPQRLTLQLARLFDVPEQLLDVIVAMDGAALITTTAAIRDLAAAQQFLAWQDLGQTDTSEATRRKILNVWNRCASTEARIGYFAGAQQMAKRISGLRRADLTPVVAAFHADSMQFPYQRAERLLAYGASFVQPAVVTPYAAAAKINVGALRQPRL